MYLNEKIGEAIRIEHSLFLLIRCYLYLPIHHSPLNYILLPPIRNISRNMGWVHVALEYCGDF